MKILQKSYVALFAVMSPFIVPTNAHAQWRWTIDPANSNINFSVAHLGISEITGNFNDFSGTIESILDDFSDMRINAVIKANSVNSGSQTRDTQLRGSDFFDVSRYSDITFVSRRVEKKGEQSFTVTGDLTMRGITRSVDLDVEFKGKVKTYEGDVVVFKARTTIDRTNWGMRWNRFIDSGGVLFGEDVTLVFTIEARHS